MKAAILIMAHDQPVHLAKLVESLSCDWTRIFIHIDRKVDAAEFKKCIPEHKNIIILDDKYRIRVNWGGFSIVEAMLNLLDVSLNSGERFARFCFLSGSDFPIKTLNHIKACFDSEKEFMRVDRRLDASCNNSHYKNVCYLHFYDMPLQKITRRIPRIPRKTYDKIKLYHGCTWWSLTEECIKYIMKFIQRNNDYTAFHKYTLCPDEIFFHSIVKSSPFAANITHDYEKANDLNSYFDLNEHGCHYIDWNAKGVTLPKVLNESDINNLLRSETLFARKFRENDSCNLIQLLEKAIEK
jgi:hypothetical protein